MRILLLLSLFLLPTAYAADNTTSSVDVGDWNIVVPSNAKMEKAYGPDFSVTYFTLKDSTSNFGIYVGGFPQVLSKKQKDVSQQKDKISGQDVVWHTWKEKSDGEELVHAETFLTTIRGNPKVELTYQEILHIFLNASDEKRLAELQKIVRTLNRKEANQPEPTQTSDLVSNDRTAIFPARKAADLVKSVCYFPPSGITGYWTPKEEDLKHIEDTLVAYLKSQNGEIKMNYWSEYRRQVAGVKKGNDSFIYISYFPLFRDSPIGSWKKKPFGVNDGGHHFFRVLYDIKKKCFVWYECNGEA